MAWLENSIMGRSAIARGQIREKHRLSEEAQGNFHYV